MSDKVETASLPVPHASSAPDESSAPADPYSIVAGSALFDRRWYLTRYPDVKAAGVDPVEHFLRRGGIELRNPSPRFNTRLYLQRHPELAGTTINPLVHFEQNGHGSIQEFLEARLHASDDEARALMQQHLELATPRPEPANDDNCSTLQPRWAAYFLARGCAAYQDGRVAESLRHFMHCVQVCAESESGFVLYRKAFAEINGEALARFERMYAGASLIVAHVSCRARLASAKASASTFNDEHGNIRNLIVIGDAALAANTYRFDPAQELLTVPASDAYEGLPKKIQQLLLFLGLADVSSPLLKVDDDFQCASLQCLARDLDQVIRAKPYGGTLTAASGPFEGATHWHLGKCEDPVLDEQPDSLLYDSPFVFGKYYWLNARAVAALGKMALIHDRVFTTEIYEDRAVGALLNHYGYDGVHFDLLESGALRQVRR